MITIICHKLLSRFWYLFPYLILSTFQSYGSDDLEEDEPKNPLLSYLIEQGDNTSTRPLKLETLPSPIIIDDHSQLNFGSEQSEFPIVDSNDRKIHYLVGSINETVWQKTKIGNINFLILAFDAIVLESTDHGLKFKRVCHPIYFDRLSKQLTLNEKDHVVFLSANGHKNQRDHQSIASLSEENPFVIQDVQKNNSFVYFHPFNISINCKAQTVIYKTFGIKNNYDSEVHAVYALLQTPALIDSFFDSLSKKYKSVVSMGLRYYSFLDMCGRCQEFLVSNQTILKPLFMAAHNKAFKSNKEPTSIPFVVVAHGNRIYKKNHYESTSRDETTYTKVKGYPYATSGPKVGDFVNDSLRRYGGALVPSSLGPNQLIMVIDEPDLGDQNKEGVIRHTFTNLEEAQFAGYGLTPKQGSVLAAKLTRADPIKVKKANLSGNHFGIDLPEFDDDPITVLSGKEITNILNYLSKCINLEELHFSKVHLSAFKPFTSLCEALPKFTKLRILDVSDCKIDHGTAPLLLSAISNLQSLQELNIGKNFIYCEGLEVLNEILPNLSNLKKLDLAYSGLCLRDGRERPDDPFIDSLQHDNSALIMLAKVIKDHRSITFLDISHYTIQIKETDIDRFKAIVQRPNLQVLNKREKFKRTDNVDFFGSFSSQEEEFDEDIGSNDDSN